MDMSDASSLSGGLDGAWSQMFISPGRKSTCLHDHAIRPDLEEACDQSHKAQWRRGRALKIARLRPTWIASSSRGNVAFYISLFVFGGAVFACGGGAFALGARDRGHQAE